MTKLRYLTISIILVISLSLAGQSFHVTARPLAASAPNLGAAGSFSVLAALSMSAAGAGTTVGGDLGLSPGLESSKTGPWTVGGSEYFGPLSLAGTAETDALGAFNNLAGQPSDGTWTGSTSPVPGVWTVASDTTFDGTLALNGGYDDVWVFQIGRDMTFSGSVVLGGNAQPCHVFWQIGRDATIAVGSTFIGTLIASRDITLVSGANVDGRIISLTGALTTDGNTITGPICASAPATATSTATSTSTATGTSTSTATGTSTSTATNLPGAATATTLPEAATATTLPEAATATTRPSNATTTMTPQATATLLPVLTSLPGTGGGPIPNKADPQIWVIAGGFSAIALFLGFRAYRRTLRHK